jgi:hypothetical protein
MLQPGNADAATLTTTKRRWLETSSLVTNLLNLHHHQPVV